MARFSRPGPHAARRLAVVAAIDEIATDTVGAVAARLTERHLTGGRIEAMSDIASTVPTECLGELCGVAPDEIPSLLSDTRSIAEVIGRGQESTPLSDAAASRLLERFDSHPSGAVAVVSMLYQNHDATAALITMTIFADGFSATRPSAVVQTVRVAAVDTAVGESKFSAGTDLTLGLESAGLEFGAGPHECPGRRLAEAIVAGVLSGLATNNYELLTNEVEVGDDGRPARLPMTRR